MTTEELENLNLILVPLGKAVLAEERDGETIYRLHSLTPLEEINDIISYAATYGVTVS